MFDGNDCSDLFAASQNRLNKQCKEMIATCPADRPGSIGVLGAAASFTLAGVLLLGHGHRTLSLASADNVFSLPA
jgi:hypothetical protein